MSQVPTATPPPPRPWSWSPHSPPVGVGWGCFTSLMVVMIIIVVRLSSPLPPVGFGLGHEDCKGDIRSILHKNSPSNQQHSCSCAGSFCRLEAANPSSDS